MSERCNVVMLGLYSIAGGAVMSIAMLDISEKFALCCGGITILIGLMCMAAVIFDIYKSRIKAKLTQHMKEMNGYHILRTFRKIYEEL